ncbi:MAG: MCE family protein [Spirochaetaceae bacterium]|nr:MAG: MCE family protein [Spirochaetaceae bacterium]
MRSPSRLGRALIFVTVCLVLIGAFFVSAISDQLLRSDDEYIVEFRNTPVSGLAVGSRVQYRGIPVGDVRDISFAPEDIETIQIRVAIDRSVPVPSDVTVGVQPIGITGVTVISLSGGTNSAPRLEPGTVLVAEGSLLDELTASARTIADSLDDIIEGVVDLVGEENRQEVTSFLRAASSILEENRSGVQSTVDNVTAGSGELVRSIETIARSAEGIERIVQHLEQTVMSLDLAETSESLNRAILAVEEVVAGAGSTVTVFDQAIRENRQTFSQTVRTLDRTINSLNDLVAQLNSDPSLLLRGRSTGGSLR